MLSRSANTNGMHVLQLEGGVDASDLLSQLANRLAALRELPIDFATSDGVLWLRCSTAQPALVAALRQLPGNHYRLSGATLLIRDGHEVAEARLPEMQWHSLAEVIDLHWPIALSAGRLVNAKPISWQLMRGGCERPASAAIVRLELLKTWVETAPQWRLNRLRYAIRRNHYDADATSTATIGSKNAAIDALVLGTPLPPVECQYLVRDAQVLIAAGMQWFPKLDVQWVLRSFDVAENQMLLWLETNRWSLVEERAFQPLSRSSIRQLSI